MQRYLKNYLTWVFVWLGFLSIIFVWFIILKARQTTNPWIADDGQWMYATAGTTLTAGKWNTLVQRTTWVDVPTSDTANFDTSCERRLITSSNTYCADNTIWDIDMVRWAGNILIVWRENWNRMVDKTAKNKIYLNATYYCNVTKLQKRCY